MQSLMLALRETGERGRGAHRSTLAQGGNLSSNSLYPHSESFAGWPSACRPRSLFCIPWPPAGTPRPVSSYLLDSRFLYTGSPMLEAKSTPNKPGSISTEWLLSLASVGLSPVCVYSEMWRIPQYHASPASHSPCVYMLQENRSQTRSSGYLGAEL